MVKKTLVVLIFLAALFWLSGCQTVQGLGRDVTWVGEAGASVLEGP
ncbi:MAG: hypothetical protein JXB29_04695 [Sedimentisphaerales bacterium]|nr:hypothetical protein [Sedimentisphaerales bacterium]